MTSVRTITAEVALVIEELVIVDVVRRDAERIAPDERRVADRAVGAALRAFKAGASMPEAITVGGRFVRCFVEHPSRTEAMSESMAR